MFLCCDAAAKRLPEGIEILPLIWVLFFFLAIENGRLTLPTLNVSIHITKNYFQCDYFSRLPRTANKKLLKKL
jgi:hypothetical protein